MIKKAAILIFLFVVLSLWTESLWAARIITVDDDGPADFNNIQAAINDANDGDTVIVAEGTYNENINFIGTNITLTSTDPNDPRVVADTVIQGDGTTCVVFFYGNEDASCRLTGFTITGGYVHHGINTGGGITGKGTMATISYCVIRDNFTDSWGGGLLECDGLISHCIISSNTTEEIGGGLAHCDGTIIDCSITGNSASMGGGLYGCNGVIDNCIINLNTTEALNSGGGASCCNSVSNCTIIGNSNGGLTQCSSVSNCTIIGNTGYKGGGLLFCDSITNCSIIGNTAEFGGGAASCGLFSNCTFSNNRANRDGGGIYCYGNDTTVINCIMWGDTAPQGDEIALFGYYVCNSLGCIFYPSSITVSYCNAEGGPTNVYTDSNCKLNWETGNINLDPCLADPGDGDYHLQSQAGRWDPNSQGWFLDDVTSPGIDTGDPANPIGYEPFPNGGVINMGAYGGTAEASKSYFGKPVCETIVAGDINGDCIVNFLDFRLMALHWCEDNRQ